MQRVKRATCAIQVQSIDKLHSRPRSRPERHCGSLGHQRRGVRKQRGSSRPSLTCWCHGMQLPETHARPLGSILRRKRAPMLGNCEGGCCPIRPVAVGVKTILTGADSSPIPDELVPTALRAARIKKRVLPSVAANRVECGSFSRPRRSHGIVVVIDLFAFGGKKFCICIPLLIEVDWLKWLKIRGGSSSSTASRLRTYRHTAARDNLRPSYPALRRTGTGHTEGCRNPDGGIQRQTWR